MESLFVWIIMSAGVAIALLGAVLFTSERELKIRRREVDELLTKLENMQPGTAPAPANAPLPDNSAALAELHAANEQLKMELSETRARLHATEAQFQGSAEIRHDSSQQQIAQAHAEVGELREKLNDSQAKVRELESARQNQVDIDALEARHRAERQSLGARVAELEREISAGREKLQELETLRAQIDRHEQEAAHWQTRIAQAEASREQLAALQKPYNELLSKHASLAEMQRELQQDLSALARLIGAPATSASPANMSNAFGHETPSPSAAPESSARLEQPEQIAMGAEAEPKRARRFGIFPALVLLAATGAFGAWYFESDSTTPVIPTVTASTQKQIAPGREPSKEPPTASAQPAVEPELTPAIGKEIAKPAARQSSESENTTPPIKPAVRVAGIYEITRASRVYSAPTEFSQLVGDIQPGMKVSVVNSRDGWLEIHSKHGRPPGFIRRDVAARIANQN